MQQEQPTSLSQPTFRTKDGQAFEVPEEGSLGLLALGYVGLMAWRQKRKEAWEAKVKINSNTPDPSKGDILPQNQVHTK